MGLDQPIEQIATTVAGLDRQHCIAELRSLPRLKLDFTDEYLDALNLDRLRHVLMAAVLQVRKGIRRAG